MSIPKYGLKASGEAWYSQWVMPSFVSALQHTLQPPAPFPVVPLARWSRAYGLSIFSIAVVLLVLYSYFGFTFPDLPTGPGADFKRAYTWMVLEPDRLSTNAIYPWTLNPLWQNFFMAPFVTMPWPWGYITFMAFTLAAAVLGAYWFGGQPIGLLLSSQMFWVLWWGQLEGWAILAVVLAWVAVGRRWWWLMTVALALATLKPQIGLAPVALLWWWSGRERWKPVAVLGGIFIYTLLVWGPWPIWYWQGMQHGAFVAQHAQSVRASLGMWAWPLLLPALCVPLSPTQRVLALAAAAQLASPYLPYYSTILLLMFNIPPWIYAVSLLGYLAPWLGPTFAWRSMVSVPLATLAWIYWPWVRARWQPRAHSVTQK
jgi:hypothetical protein